MAACDYCADAEKGEKIFEDESVVALMSSQPASRGHVMVFPREHYTILEQVPDFLVGHLFAVANTISTTIFEILRVHGTNLIIENGTAAGQKTAHVAINIIPRSENDGLGFNWQPKQFTDDEMATAVLQLQEASKNVGAFEEEKKTPLSLDKEDTALPKASEDDYFLRQLHRLP
jgi:histidine triad (HIT) family protein